MSQPKPGQQIALGPHLPHPASRPTSTVSTPGVVWSHANPLHVGKPQQYLPTPLSTSSASPSVDLQSRGTPHSTVTDLSSPAYHFPAPKGTQTPLGLSPSGMPFPRNSPYKPIRGVNTLLVPPPSATIQHGPQQMSSSQMHYQPLGKPISERRTGVLPYLHFDTWSQPQHANPQPLPQPRLRA